MYKKLWLVTAVAGMVGTLPLVVRSEEMSYKPLVHGHRGARAVRPENTIPAFEFAIEAGADVLELDMSVTKDNVIVVSHDPILRPPVCTGGPQATAFIRKLTLEEVKKWDCGAKQNPEFATQKTIPGTRMPTLDEVFALASRGKFQFNIETKSTAKRLSEEEKSAALRQLKVAPDSAQAKDIRVLLDQIGPELTPPPDEFAKLVVDKVKQYHLEDRVIVQSFDFRTLHALKKIAPEIRRSALFMAAGKSFVEMAKEADATIVSPLHTIVRPELVSEAHAAGLQVVPWTANKVTDWDRLVVAKPDAIITDDPAGLIAYLKSKNLR